MNLIPHIYLHSVAPEKNKNWYKSFLTVEMSFFEKFIQYLVSKKYIFIHFDEYFDYLHNPLYKKNKFICLSFDDGYLDNYVFVLPILKKYKIKATVFVNPEFVQDNSEKRATLESVWQGKKSLNDIESLGFASWDELKIIQESGFFDIQSHTMTHTKHYVSDKIIGFHHPESDYLYPICNLFPERKPYYMTDESFINLIPFGTPFFEDRSSVVAKRIWVNQDFIDQCIELIGHDYYSFNIAFNKIKKIYLDFKNKERLIVKQESENEYSIRVKEEIINSKKIIENKLGKPVLHCCWPHGDYNNYCHDIAMEAGYKTSTIVLRPGDRLTDPSRIMRNGYSPLYNSFFLSNLKILYKINSFKEVFPYDLIQQIYYLFKYRS